MKIQTGEVFSIRLNRGFGFLQFIKTSDLGVEHIRVLESIKHTNELLQKEVDLRERYTIQFALKAAYRRKMIEKVGVFNIPERYSIPTKARSEHTVRGEFLGWHIVDQCTLKRELKKTLSVEDIQLPPHGHPNTTLLIEWLENDWRLENWK